MATKLTFHDVVVKNNATPSPVFTHATYTLGATDTVSFDAKILVYEPASTGIAMGAYVGLIKMVSGTATLVNGTITSISGFTGGGYDDDGIFVMALVSGVITPKVTGTATGKTVNWDLWIDYYI
ncbi:MAG TPA: hypothetical protein VM577_07145 [Anaerovoracaceae bacterium]|nr:hypothetical protein [Anaerovoracaceae bacterium]